MRHFVLPAVVVLGACFAVACGDASTNTAGFYRQGRSGDVPPGDQGTGGAGGASGSTAGSSSGASSSSGSTGTPGPTGGTTDPKTFEILLDKSSVSGDVNAKHEVQVTVSPKSGFTGSVTLAATGLPADAIATWDKPTVDVGAGAATARLTIDTKSTSPVGAATLKITGTAGATTASSNVSVTINPTMTFTFRMNATGANYMEDIQGRAIPPGTYNIAAGSANTLTVKVTNKDGTGHIVHGPGGNFPHGNVGAPIPSGGTDPVGRTVAKGSPIQFYAHDLNNTGNMTRVQFQ